MFCSWESREAINDDDKIQEFHTLNDSPPPDPPLTQAELDQELRKDRPRSVLSARRTSHWNKLWELESHIHSQIRSLHFLKFNELPPRALTLECGPHTAGLAYGGYQVSFSYEQTNEIKPEKKLLYYITLYYILYIPYTSVLLTNPNELNQNRP